MILIRETRPEVSLAGTVVGSRTTPSTRIRTRMSPWRESKWMSDAPRAMASAMIELMSLTTGASFPEARRSRVSGSGSSSPSWSSVIASTESLRWESWEMTASTPSGVAMARRTR